MKKRKVKRVPLISKIISKLKQVLFAITSCIIFLIFFRGTSVDFEPSPLGFYILVLGIYPIFILIFFYVIYYTEDFPINNQNIKDTLKEIDCAEVVIKATPISMVLVLAILPTLFIKFIVLSFCNVLSDTPVIQKANVIAVDCKHITKGRGSHESTEVTVFTKDKHELTISYPAHTCEKKPEFKIFLNKEVKLVGRSSFLGNVYDDLKYVPLSSAMCMRPLMG